MNTSLKALAFATASLCSLMAHASDITFETASSTAGPQSSAAAYLSTVDAALTGASAKSTQVTQYNNLSNQSVFGGSNSNIAYDITVTFDVTAAQAGTWGLRAGVDFGNGGAVFLDGTALGYNAGNMWWAGSYADPTQSFQYSAVPMTAGVHTFTIVGLENCCDGGQQAQFSINGGTFTTFSSNDGLVAAVPEPGTYALMLAGLGAVSLIARRRKAAQA